MGYVEDGEGAFVRSGFLIWDEMIGISCVRIGSVSLFIGQGGKVVVVGNVMSEWRRSLRFSFSYHSRIKT